MYNDKNQTATAERPQNRQNNQPILSASSLINTDVRNAKDEKLGTIKDLMIDTKTGEISYAVLSFGGFLGMGDKLFAVPMEALQADTKHENFMLDVDKDRLENAPGFDKDNWPKTSQNDFVEQVYNHYGFQDRYKQRFSR